MKVNAKPQGPGVAGPCTQAPKRLVGLGAVAGLLLLSGCASGRVHQDPSLQQYNPATGYPAVGTTPVGS